VLLVDTNVLSELMRPRPAPVLVRWAAAQARFALSVVTIEEVEFGLALRRSARLEAVFEALLTEHCTVFDVTVGVARRSAALRATLRTGGRTRTQADMLIAGTAAEHGLAVATRNVRDFDGCGVRVVNPFVA